MIIILQQENESCRVFKPNSRPRRKLSDDPKTVKTVMYMLSFSCSSRGSLSLKNNIKCQWTLWWMASVTLAQKVMSSSPDGDDNIALFF